MTDLSQHRNKNNEQHHGNQGGEQSAPSAISKPTYPQWIGCKFSSSGAALPWPGNAILAHLPPHSPFRSTLDALTAALQQQPFASCFTLLPPSSWHMTIYEGVTDRVRLRHTWPGDLALDAPLKLCHAHVATQLATNLAHNLGPDGVGRVEIIGFWPIEDGICFSLRPSDACVEEKLRGLRDRVSERLRMRHSGHETYSWHMGFAYTLRLLTPDERAEIMKFLNAWLEERPRSLELGVPEFVVYDDMCEMRRVFYLSSQ